MSSYFQNERLTDQFSGPVVTNAKRLNFSLYALCEENLLWPPAPKDHIYRARIPNLYADSEAEHLAERIAYNSYCSIQSLKVGIKGGVLSVWIAPEFGKEVVFDALALYCIDTRTVQSGFYNPVSGGNTAHIGRPLWIKHEDLFAFTADLRESLASYGEKWALGLIPEYVRGCRTRAAKVRGVPSNRQLDHAAIVQRVVEMRRNQPGLSKGSAAASIVAELPPNPKSGKPRDTRNIERMIAHLWEGGLL